RLLEDGAGAVGAGVGDLLARARDDVIVLIGPEIRDVVAVIVGEQEIALAGQARHIVVFVERTLNLGLFSLVPSGKIGGRRGAAAVERRRIDILADACAHGADIGSVSVVALSGHRLAETRQALLIGRLDFWTVGFPFKPR